MAFAETAQVRKVRNGTCPVEITLAGSVGAGDCIGYSSGWKLSADAATIQPILVAGVSGLSGQKIVAYLSAEVWCVNTSGNVGTVGEIVMLADDGSYASTDSATGPEVGFVSAIGSDNLTTVVMAFPMIPQATVPRS